MNIRNEGECFSLTLPRKLQGKKIREEYFLNESSNPFRINWGHIYSVMAPKTNLETEPISVTKFWNQIPSHHSNSNKLPMWQIHHDFYLLQEIRELWHVGSKNDNPTFKMHGCLSKNDVFRTTLNFNFPKHDLHNCIMSVTQLHFTPVLLIFSLASLVMRNQPWP